MSAAAWLAKSALQSAATHCQPQKPHIHLRTVSLRVRTNRELEVAGASGRKLVRLLHHLYACQLEMLYRRAITWLRAAPSCAVAAGLLGLWRKAPQLLRRSHLALVPPQMHGLEVEALWEGVRVDEVLLALGRRRKLWHLSPCLASYMLRRRLLIQHSTPL